MRKIFFLAYLLSFTLNVQSQSQVQTFTSIQSEIDSLSEASSKLVRTNLDSSTLLAKKALQLSLSINDSSRSSDALNAIGATHFMRGTFDSALFYFSNSYKIRFELQDVEKIAASLNNLALVYERQENFSKAIETYEQALDIFLNKKDSTHIAHVYGNLGILYETIYDHQKALYFHRKEIIMLRGDKKELSRTYLNMGLVYSAMGKYDSAHLLYNKSLKMKKTFDDNWGTAVVLASIAEAYGWQNRPDSALYYYEKAKSYMVPLKANHLLAMANIQIAKLYHERNKELEALEILRQSEEYLEEQDVGAQSDAYLTFAEIYNSMGELDSSIYYYELFARKSDSLRIIDIEGKLSEQKAELYYNNKQKENEYNLKINELEYLRQLGQEKRVNDLLIMLLLLGVLILIISTIFYQKIIKKNKQLTIQRKEIARLNALQEDVIKMKSEQLLASQGIIEQYAHLNAHELRGPLARILGLINLFDSDNLDKKDLWKRIKVNVNEMETIVQKIARELEKTAK